jgi:hypothetical protein
MLVERRMPDQNVIDQLFNLASGAIYGGMSAITGENYWLAKRLS